MRVWEITETIKSLGYVRIFSKLKLETSFSHNRGAMNTILNSKQGDSARRQDDSHREKKPVAHTS